MLSSHRMSMVRTNAAALGVSRKQVMESSGAAVAREARDVADPEATIAVVGGRGDAGGCAFVAARFLDEYDASVHALGRLESVSIPAARENREALARAEYDVRTVADSRDLHLGTPDVIVDGVLGVDRPGVPEELDRSAIEAIDAADAATVSVDVPSGVDPDTGEVADVAVEADRVVTFHDRKPALEGRSGVTVVDVGIPPAAEALVGPGDVDPIRHRLRGNKREGEGDTGRVFVVGGGPYTGAPALSAQAALRAGADLSFVAVPESVGEPIQGYTENLIVQPYDGEHLAPDRVDELVETATQHDDVVVLGPGLGDAEETREAVRRFLDAFDGRAVVDADAIPLVPEAETDATLVVTPNREELAELGGPRVEEVRDGTDEIEAFAADLGHVVLVKGRETLVSDGDRTRRCREGSPGMTVGGTGDVLSGLVAAFLGVADPFQAACGAAYVKGRAGERLAGEYGTGFVATDLFEAIPRVIGERETRTK